MAINFIQLEKFKSLAWCTYAPKNKPPDKERDDYDKLENTFNPSELKDCNLVYTHAMYVMALFDIIQYLPSKFIIITSSCDCSIEDYGLMRPNGRGGVMYKEKFDIPENVVKWYAKNVNTDNPKVESIPIGLENNIWCTKVFKKEKMEKLLMREKKHRNLLYINHTVKTNPKKRELLYMMFAKKEWSTAANGSNGVEFDMYLDNLYNHKFVLSPEGNGMDTHRTWECLYMETIPIEKKNNNNRFYRDFPICFVDDWSQVTKEFLEKEYERISNIKWDFYKLSFDYWKIKISTYADFMNDVSSKVENRSGYRTHQLVLLDTLLKTDKPVLELGSGYHSTELINSVAKLKGFSCVTVEADEEWLAKFIHLQSPKHVFHNITDDKLPVFYDNDTTDWGVVFIDNPTWTARVQAIMKYHNVADYIVLHDCDALFSLQDKPFGAGDMIDGVNKIMGIRDYGKFFKYWIEFFVEGWQRWHPPVLLASNKVNLNNIKGIEGMVISNRNKR